jgi:hypothetical protein
MRAPFTEARSESFMNKICSTWKIVRLNTSSRYHPLLLFAPPPPLWLDFLLSLCEGGCGFDRLGRWGNQTFRVLVLLQQIVSQGSSLPPPPPILTLASIDSPVAFSRKEWSADFRQALRMRISSEIPASEFFEAFKVPFPSSPLRDHPP